MLDPPATERATRAPYKSYIKAVPPTETSRKLQAALFDWRDQNAPRKFAPAILQNMGSYIFLSDQIISRIVDCARADKIASVALLSKETSWRKEWVDEFGESILSVVRSFYPPPTVTTASSTPTVHRRKPRAPAKCSACGNIGHNSSKRTCPKRIAARLQGFTDSLLPLDADIENVPPHPPPPATPSRPLLEQQPASTPLAGSSRLADLATPLVYQHLAPRQAIQPMSFSMPLYYPTTPLHYSTTPLHYSTPLAGTPSSPPNSTPLIYQHLLQPHPYLSPYPPHPQPPPSR